MSYSTCEMNMAAAAMEMKMAIFIEIAAAPSRKNFSSVVFSGRHVINSKKWSRKNFCSVIFSGRHVSNSWNRSHGGLKKLHYKCFLSPHCWMDLPHTRMLFSHLFLGQYGFLSPRWGSWPGPRPAIARSWPRSWTPPWREKIHTGLEKGARISQCGVWPSEPRGGNRKFRGAAM